MTKVKQAKKVRLDLPEFEADIEAVLLKHFGDSAVRAHPIMAEYLVNCFASFVEAAERLETDAGMHLSQTH